MQTIQANFTASISELKKSPAQILKQAEDNVVAILNHNVPSAYLVPSALKEWQKLDNSVKAQFKKKLVERLETPQGSQRQTARL